MTYLDRKGNETMFDRLAMYWRFISGLRGFINNPLTLESAQKIIAEKIRNREPNFLSSVKRTIYENEKSPYLQLLKLAGCKFGDLERMVRSEGIEGCLKQLAKQGVYVSYEEFKRRKDVVRGSNTFQFKKSDFDNPLTLANLEIRSSGSRSAGTQTMYDFNHLIDQAVYIPTIEQVLGTTNSPKVIWLPIMPGSGPFAILLYIKIGEPVVRWFSPVTSRNIRPTLANRMATSYIVNGSRLFGAKFPSPEYVPLDEAWRIAEAVANVLKQHGRCTLMAYTSSAARVCQAAREKGINIAGAKIIVFGEPLTEAKAHEFELVGVRVCSNYGFSEAGSVGFACFNPGHIDEVHLQQYAFALIQHPRAIPHADVSVNAFLFTSLLPNAPKILFNMEPGDYGVIEKRECGCELQKLGFSDHIYQIRGFDKLTGEGMTFIGTDFVRIIEEVLPAKFGGSPMDYQMLEDEDEASHTRMSVIVSPKLGNIDDNEIIKTILNELNKGTDGQRMMAKIWSEAGTLRVKRMNPFTTSGGKLLPLHIEKKS
jgi:hypothetical protein